MAPVSNRRQFKWRTPAMTGFYLRSSFQRAWGQPPARNERLKKSAFACGLRACDNPAGDSARDAARYSSYPVARPPARPRSGKPTVTASTAHLRSPCGPAAARDPPTPPGPRSRMHSRDVQRGVRAVLSRRGRREKQEKRSSKFQRSKRSAVRQEEPPLPADEITDRRARDTAANPPARPSRSPTRPPPAALPSSPFNLFPLLFRSLRDLLFNI